MICKMVVKDVSIRIGKDKMKWDFMPLPINEFDVILGMDGLNRYQANVNCHERQVVFEKDDGGKIYFVGKGRNMPTKIISAMTTIKYLMKGCEAYLAFVIDKRKDGVSWSVYLV